MIGNHKKKISTENKKSIGFSWLISFLKILIIPMIALCAVYFKYDNQLEKRMTELNSYVFDRTLENVTNIMGDVYDIRIAFCRGENFRAVMSIKNYDDYFSNADVYSYISDLKLSGMYNSSYLCYVYIEDTDSVISKNGIVKSKGYYDAYISGMNISYEEWMNAIQPKKFDDSANLVAANNLNGSRVRYALSPIDSSYDNYKCSIVIDIDKSIFFPVSDDMGILSECDVYVFDTNGGLLASQVKSGSALAPEEVLKMQHSPRGKQLLRETAGIDTAKWTVVMLTPNSVYKKDLIYMRYFFGVVILFCIGVSFIMIKKQVRYNYRPVMNLLSIVGKSGGTDEYGELGKSILAVMSENKKLSTDVEKQRNVLKKVALIRLLQGTYRMYYSEAELSRFGIDFIHGYYVVASFEIQNVEMLFIDDDELSDRQRYSAASFIAENVFSELFGEIGIVYYCECDNKYSFIINLEYSDDMLRSISDKAEYGIKFIRDNFEINLIYGISDPKGGVESISEAFSESVSVIEHRQFYNVHNIIFFNQIKKEKTGKKYLSFEESVGFINFIKAGNKDGALRVITKPIDMIMKNNDTSITNTKEILYDIINLIIKIPQEMSVNSNEISEVIDTERLYKCTDNIDEFKKLTENTVEEVCGIVNRQKEDDNQFVSRMIEYVKENYMDANLSMAVIGEYLNLYPSYVSKVFKEKTGMGLLEYIHKYRIEEAKRLMKTTDEPINKIVTMVGYSNVRTFNRIFKKYSGETPSEFRKMYE